MALGLISIPYFWYPLYHLRSTRTPIKESNPKHYPSVAVVFAAFNEAGIIEQKLESIFNTNYPVENLEVWVGSDLSDDGTDDIVRKMQQKYSRLQLHVNKVRSGKSATINELVEKAQCDIIVATDANIIFDRNTIGELVWPLHQGFSATAGNLQYGSIPMGEQTAVAENLYLGIENKVRYSESLKYGFCLGMEGGLYAIQKSLWTPIPPATFMEDFFQTVKIIEKGGRIYFNPKALGYEDVSTSLSEEYKRKVRISIGNFQNLNRFKSLIIKRFRTFGFPFLAHKVLRWYTPHLLLFGTICSLLSGEMLLYLPLITLPLVALIFALARIQTPLTYFYAMNTALLRGHIKYLGGINSSVWQPTKRNQHES